MWVENIAGQEVCAEVPAPMPAATLGDWGSGVIVSAGIYSAGIAVEAAQPLEMSVVTQHMFAAANTAAADTVSSTADSAAASSSTATVVARSETAEELETALHSADIVAVAAATYSGTLSEAVEFAARSKSYCSYCS